MCTSGQAKIYHSCNLLTILATLLICLHLVNQMYIILGTNLGVSCYGFIMGVRPVSMYSFMAQLPRL